MKAFSWVAEEATILCFKHYDLAGIQDFKVEFFGHVSIVRLQDQWAGVCSLLFIICILVTRRNRRL